MLFHLDEHKRVGDLVPDYTYQEIKEDNPDLDKFVRPDGTAGNVPMGSISDWVTYLKNHSNSEKAGWSKELARDSAVGVARAMGFGV
jgi:hypothetical protein